MTKTETTKHKRYIAFAGSDYYPCGGWNDLIGFFDTIDQAKEAMRGGHNWRQIIDTNTMEEI